MSQTITRNDGNVSVYVFDDSVNVDLSATPNATVRNNGGNDFDIGDLDSSNATLHTGVTVPDGWMGGKHTYDGSAWGDASGWVDPRAAMLESEKSRYAADSTYSSTFTDAIQAEADRIKAL
jgi:hypothetical protein